MGASLIAAATAPKKELCVPHTAGLRLPLLGDVLPGTFADCAGMSKQAIRELTWSDESRTSPKFEQNACMESPENLRSPTPNRAIDASRYSLTELQLVHVSAYETPGVIEP